MRAAILVIALTILAYDFAGSAKQHSILVTNGPPSIASSKSASRVDFDADVKPILQAKCTPCHFNGGQMYARLPFDRPDTIRKLGERLFTRIQDEKDRRTIRDFLAQQP